MGDSITEGTVIEWLKAPGDAVAEDEVVVVIETDKVRAGGGGGRAGGAAGRAGGARGAARGGRSRLAPPRPPAQIAGEGARRAAPAAPPLPPLPQPGPALPWRLLQVPPLPPAPAPFP
ncbi:unnamed protein product, partial [Heterosigma akashiwo]